MVPHDDAMFSRNICADAARHHADDRCCQDFEFDREAHPMIGFLDHPTEADAGAVACRRFLQIRGSPVVDEVSRCRPRSAR